MSEEQAFETAEIYQIRVHGILQEKWSDWFNGFTITHPNECETLLVGPVSDQSALHGLLAKIRDLGLTLRSVECLSQDNNQKNQTR
jgi:hypothetical protein